jgi:hypothetical protein
MMDNLQEQLSRLQERVEIMMEDYVTPRLCDFADRLRGHRETVSEQVCNRPLIAMFVAFGVGYVVGRAR